MHGFVENDLKSCALRCLETSSPLHERLAAYAAAVRRFEPGFAVIVDRMVDGLRKTKAGAFAPPIGGLMPPFALPDEDGRLRSLSEFLDGGQTVVFFDRGHWCTYCRITTRALDRIEAEVSARGGQLVMITPETQRYTRKLKADSGCRFPILSDMDCGYALDLNLAIQVSDDVRRSMESDGIDTPVYHGNDSWMFPITAVFVLGRDGIIKARSVDPDYRKRMDTQEILAALDS